MKLLVLTVISIKSMELSESIKLDYMIKKYLINDIFYLETSKC